MVKVGLINNRHPMPVQNYICTCTSVCCVWSGINFNAL